MDAELADVDSAALDAADEGVEDPAAAAPEDARQAKLRQLRERLQASALANRRDVVAEHNRARQTAADSKRLERKRVKAEALSERLDAAGTGEDLERKRNWDYDIGDNERWEKKKSRKATRAKFELTDFDDAARLKYKKDIDALKPDMAAYNAKRDAIAQDAMSGTMMHAGPSGVGGAVSRASEALYRDANSFVYADHKPNDDQIDRVVKKLNDDVDKRQKRSRVRKNEGEEDVTYINERNKHFNKKLSRYYDRFTSDLKDSFERGTAL